MNYKHGLTKHPLYAVWKAMRNRCTNRNDPAYSRYGGRGITMCAAWLEDFPRFYEWATANGWAKGLSIDRVDNDGGYCPDNCRFTDRKTQSRNVRRNRVFTVDGVTMCLKDWAAADRCQVSYGVLYHRVIKAGWDIEQAMDTPIGYTPPETIAVGSTHGRLVIEGFCDIRKPRLIHCAVCKCQCGKRVTPPIAGLLSGRYKSCGCRGCPLIAAFGEQKNSSQWAKDHRCRVGRGTLRSRIKAGWNAEDAITTPAA